MIQYVLTVSVFFPKTHSKAGEITSFPINILHGYKSHTIRGNYDLWAKRFEKINKGVACLSVRIWTGKPYNSPQLEIFKFYRHDNIGLEKLVLEPKCFPVGSQNHININGAFFHPKILDALAKNDGLSVEDFKEWFSKSDKSKEMAIIHFTGFRYCKLPI